MLKQGSEKITSDQESINLRNMLRNQIYKFLIHNFDSILPIGISFIFILSFCGKEQNKSLC